MKFKKFRKRCQENFKTLLHEVKYLCVPFLTFFILATLLLKALHFIPQAFFYEIKNLATEDIDLNDIYYFSNKNDAKKSVVIVNIGSVPKDSIRSKLVALLPKLIDAPTRSIGIDLSFVEAKNKDTDKSLLQFLQNKKVITGFEKDMEPFFKENTQLGCTNLPTKEDMTVREYYNYCKVNNFSNHQKDTVINSFARKLVFPNESIDTTKIKAVSYIKYQSIENGFYNYFDSKEELYEKFNFPCIEANDVLNNRKGVAALLKDKIVIIGWVGNDYMSNPNDITDKHRVPVDFKLFNRLPIMPGTLIHANAVEMHLKHDSIQKIEGWKHYFLLLLLLFIYFYVFALFEKPLSKYFGLNFILEILFLIFSAYLLVGFSIAMMGWGWHFKIGQLFIYVALLIEFKAFNHEFEKYFHKISAKFKSYLNS